MQGKIDLFSDACIWTPIFIFNSGYSSEFRSNHKTELEHVWRISRGLGLKRLQEDLVWKDFMRTWSQKGHFSAEPLKHFRVVALQVGDAQTRISHLRFLLTSHTIQISESDHDCSMPTPRFSLVFGTPPSLHAQLYWPRNIYFASIKINKENFLLHLLSIHHASLILVKGGKWWKLSHWQFPRAPFWSTAHQIQFYCARDRKQNWPLSLLRKPSCRESISQS